MPTPAAQFAATYAVLTAAHEVGDYIVQRDTDATTKGKPGPDGAAACARHVATYTATQALALLAANQLLGLRLRPARIAAALALSAATHYPADRCNRRWTDTSDQAPALVRAAHRIGKTGWIVNDPNAGALLDQAWHKGWIAIAATVAASRSATPAEHP